MQYTLGDAPGRRRQSRSSVERAKGAECGHVGGSGFQRRERHGLETVSNAKRLTGGQSTLRSAAMASSSRRTAVRRFSSGPCRRGPLALAIVTRLMVTEFAEGFRDGIERLRETASGSRSAAAS